MTILRGCIVMETHGHQQNNRAYSPVSVNTARSALEQTSVGSMEDVFSLGTDISIKCRPTVA